MEARKQVENPVDNASPATPPTRTQKGILVRPHQQFRVAMILVVSGIAAQALVIGTMAYFIHSTITDVVSANQLNPEVGASISQAVSFSMSVLFAIAVVYALVAGYIGVKLSHRIYGPLVSFTRHIDKLKEGFYSHRMNLRRTDELKELRDALNDLAEELQARHGSR